MVDADLLGAGVLGVLLVPKLKPVDQVVELVIDRPLQDRAGVVRIPREWVRAGPVVLFHAPLVGAVQILAGVHGEAEDLSRATREKGSQI